MSSSDRSPASSGWPPTLTPPDDGGRGPVAPVTARIPPDKAPIKPTRRFILLAPLALAACGFTPAYAPGGAATRLQDKVRAADPTDKNSFDLVERLEERLGRGKGAPYRLSYTIVTEAVGVGITTENEITRYNLKGVVEYTLSDEATGARITGGRVQSFTAYSATGSTVAGLAAEEDAATRLMRILADQIVARLIAAAATLP